MWQRRRLKNSGVIIAKPFVSSTIRCAVTIMSKIFMSCLASACMFLAGGVDAAVVGSGVGLLQGAHVVPEVGSSVPLQLNMGSQVLMPVARLGDGGKLALNMSSRPPERRNDLAGGVDLAGMKDGGLEADVLIAGFVVLLVLVLHRVSR